MSPIIEINDPAFNGPNTIVIDARGGQDSYQRYLSGHLKNAVYADLDKHLAAKVTDASIGGRHPLPPINDFAALLGNWGINPESHVIVYDDKSAAMSAARLWWMLKAIGHKNVRVLNGGLKAATDAGISLSTELYNPTPVKPYQVTGNYAGTVDIEEAGKVAQSNEKVVIDVRETPRYLGQTEPIDLIAGHIPGAINLPYISNMDASGKYLLPDALRKAYDEAINGIPYDQVIVHCGSGVTACHTLLGMAYAGIEGPKLYVGSWSEWSRRDLPIATNEL
ncbi:thiosulfate/3-mercaptopyruvate sulfurtransferase [Mucilaginibacter frigoritolerans]|uniref:Thiosulfate/3-mercaptopyruvate sulfurtransferase n=1 Tax=Mucilaginibacter frigoritolerans TaxID=652788 RepID=A0A562UG16_9SPHI|nr:sulfurtransferase [Mucilaginibacter frigoritolerans]TWJ04317.1 thiosulfate/3-mercaptopyruvate sulfurtransferase [Mucilaginibacter frigoritolerans]